MADNDESRVATIILRQFHGYGDAGEHTMPFDELPSNVRANLLSEIRCDAYELPVVANYQSQSNWSVLTTRRLIVREELTIVTIAWLDIAEITVDLSAVESDPDPKGNLNTLTVVTIGGQRVTISTDRGPPFLAFWNSLIMAKRMAPEEERRRAP